MYEGGGVKRNGMASVCQLSLFAFGGWNLLNCCAGKWPLLTEKAHAEPGSNPASLPPENHLWAPCTTTRGGRPVDRDIMRFCWQMRQ